MSAEIVQKCSLATLHSVRHHREIVFCVVIDQRYLSVSSITGFRMHSDLHVEPLMSHVSVNLGAGVALPETQTLEMHLHRLLDHIVQRLVL